jgi:hypothetical protein
VFFSGEKNAKMERLPEVHLVLARVVISDCPRPLSLQDGNVLLFLESTDQKVVP